MYNLIFKALKPKTFLKLNFVFNTIYDLHYYNNIYSMHLNIGISFLYSNFHYYWRGPPFLCWIQLPTNAQDIQRKQCRRQFRFTVMFNFVWLVVFLYTYFYAHFEISHQKSCKEKAKSDKKNFFFKRFLRSLEVDFAFGEKVLIWWMGYVCRTSLPRCSANSPVCRPKCVQFPETTKRATCELCDNST